ncbi:hypothetical protein EVAR_49204_1 [Eumeta japonica]|uniref:Uncharacterized protein n=1 Tax=Eumeta variegata TaxID=151549 RepID=A0A4C1XMB7_EUMVA|nr:hypothetical protein EVAR_49204_1 [Eumeta japonica]
MSEDACVRVLGRLINAGLPTAAPGATDAAKSKRKYRLQLPVRANERVRADDARPSCTLISQSDPGGPRGSTGDSTGVYVERIKKWRFTIVSGGA